MLAAAEREKNQKRMAVAERDRHYRAILSQLELDPVDRADLVKRGFTDEQIERYAFKSVRGAKFSEQMTPAALFNKALELIGYKPVKEKRQGTGSRLNIYRLGTAADAVAALEQIKAAGDDGLKLFRAELSVVRAQTRQSIDAAAKKQIIAKALAWVDEHAEIQIKGAIAAINQRHADLIDPWLSKLGDVVRMDASLPLYEMNQMALINLNSAVPPPIPSSNSFTEYPFELLTSR